MRAMLLIFLQLTVCFSSVLGAQSQFERLQAIYDSAVMPELSDLRTEALWGGIHAAPPGKSLNGRFAYLAVFKNSDPLVGEDLVYAISMSTNYSNVSVSGALYEARQLQAQMGASAVYPYPNVDALATTLWTEEGWQTAYLLRKTSQEDGNLAFVVKVICYHSPGCGYEPYGATLFYAYYTRVWMQ